MMKCPLRVFCLEKQSKFFSFFSIKFYQDASRLSAQARTKVSAEVKSPALSRELGLYQIIKLVAHLGGLSMQEA